MPSMPAFESYVDELGDVQIVNETDIPLTAADIAPALASAFQQNPMVAEMVRWNRTVHGGEHNRRGGMLQRDRFVTPGDTFEQIRTARAAMDDDVVDGIAELTQGLAFKRVGFYAQDEDEENIWNQWAGTVNLDGLLREAWDTYFTDSQVVFTVWWGNESYKVDGTTDQGNARRRTFDLRVPTSIDVIDTLKVTPVGELLFGRERLAYIASPGEAEQFTAVLDGARNTIPPGSLLPYNAPLRWDNDPELTDDIVLRLIESRYIPNWDERRLLLNEGVDPNWLFLMRENTVFRHTATKPGWKRFPRIRMKSTFELLDMKRQIRQKDRVFLLAGINFILVIKRGSDKFPADDVELAAAHAGVTTLAQLPIIVGPHTLSVEIVAPPMDHTVSHDAWDVLDTRIAARLLRQFGPRAAQRTHEGDLAQLVGHWLESERHMLRRTFEANVFDKIRKVNATNLTGAAKLRFHPNRIALAFDPAYATFLLDLRAARELSRDTLLSAFDMTQEDEAEMLEREAKEFDPIFQTLATPGAAPATNPNPAIPLPNESGGPSHPTSEPGGGTVKVTVTAPAAPGAPAASPAKGPAAQRRAGRQGGGNRAGGGAAPGTGQGKAPRGGVAKADLAAWTKGQLIAEARHLEIVGRGAMDKEQLMVAIADELELEDLE